MKFIQIFCLGAALLVGACPPALGADGMTPRVILESGVSHPYGILGGDADHSRLGQGARDGLRLAFGLRLPLSRTVFLTPSFAFVDYGDFNGSTAEVAEISIESSSYRYGLELMVRADGPPSRVKPLLAVAMGLDRNRLVGNYQDPTAFRDQSINTLGYTLRAGFQWNSLEFSAAYHINRFNTWQFYYSNYRERYNWDSLDVRAGWILPFGD
ncbi:hypothetical protein CSB20_01840 [bacterium DOLZORAL124_64_63]|nr:MAG: hypothetical protein CSB20_01840 [bacterium DOLZORAL124_64_63]